MSPEKALGCYRYMFVSEVYKKRFVGVAIDEAHCILEWGPEFRTLYGELFRLRLLMGVHIPWCALTATLNQTDRAVWNFHCLLIKFTNSFTGDHFEPRAEKSHPH